MSSATDPAGNIRDLAHALPDPPAGEHAYSAARLSQASEVRVARGQKGFALILPSHGATPRPDVHLRNINVAHRVRCRVLDAEATLEDTFAIVQCTSSESTMQDLFLETLGLLLADEHAPSAEALSRLLDDLVALFSGLDAAPRTSKLGLWGELWLLAGAASPDIAAGSWHLMPGERWDFARERSRVEVKTAVGARRHHFTLEQLCPPPSIVVVVASIVTTDLGTGPSIMDLLASAVAGTSSSDDASKIVKTAMLSLGRGWQEGRLARFDAALAAETLRFLPAQAIPRVPQPPVEVSQVHFQSDVEDVEVVDSNALDPLSRALFPRRSG